MRSFIPFDVTDEMLVSSTIAEPDIAEPAYDPEATYAEFDQVSVISENSHKVFESLVNDNTGNDPLTTNSDVLQENAKWILKSNTNRFRMFDMNQGNPSIGTSPMTVVLRPGKRIDALALDLKAAVIDITVRNGIDGPIIYTLDGYLLERNVTSRYEFFFAPFVYKKLICTFRVPPAPDPVIYLTLTDPSGKVELNRFAVGLSVYLGEVQDTGPIIDTDNYSEITTDGFGKTTFNPVPSIPKAELTIFAKANKTNLIQQYKKESEAKIAFWSGLDDIDNPYTQSLALFGFHRNFPIDPSDPNIVVAKLSLKGV